LEKESNPLMNKYDQKYFEETTFGLTGNPLRDSLSKLVYRSAPLVRALMIKLFLHPKTVLDVGCGKGTLVLWLRRLGVEAFGVDLSDYTLKNAPASARKYLRRANVLDLPFKSGSFDLVTTFALLEHIPEKDLPKAIKECRRVAKRQTLHKIYGTSRFEQIFPVKDPTHVTVRSYRWWQKLFQQLNLRPSKKFLPRWEAGIFLLEGEFLKGKVGLK